MKFRSLGVTSLMLASIVAVAAVPEGYYDALNGKTGKALRQAAKSVVRKHTAISYSSGTWDAFKTTDTRFVDGRSAWWDMYSNNVVYTSQGHDGLNVEHSVANSWWGGSKNDAYKDLFHLYPSDSKANSSRGNYPLGEVQSVSWTNTVIKVGSPKSGQGGGNGKVWEPADEYKGDFARSYMYMFTVYDDINWSSSTAYMYSIDGSVAEFKPWAVELLLRWSTNDPVSQKEVNRNNAIYGIQHNRNPFIDAPELAEYIWGSKNGQAYTFKGAYVPGETPVDPPVDPDPPVGPDDPDDPVVGAEGTWVAVNSLSGVNSEDDYILVSNNSWFGVSTEVNNTYITPTESLNRDYDDVKDSFSKVPEDIAVFRFVNQGSGKYSAYYLTQSGKKMFIKSTQNKVVSYSESDDASAHVFTLKVNPDAAVIDFGGEIGSLQYNKQSPRFTTYTSSQTDLKLYRLVKQDTSTELNEIDAVVGDLRIFNLQGNEMGNELDALPGGIYIVVAPGKSPVKVMKR